MAQVPLFDNTVLILPLFFSCSFPWNTTAHYTITKYPAKKALLHAQRVFFFSHKAIIFGAVSL